MESVASISETFGFITNYLSSSKRRRGDYLFPLWPRHRYTSLQEHSLLPADHSGLKAMRGPIPLLPFYQESGPMLVEVYLFSPFHDTRHLPAGDSKSRILLCKESTSRMIFEEIYMIDLYFHKLNQSFFYFEFQSCVP